MESRDTHDFVWTVRDAMHLQVWWKLPVFLIFQIPYHFAWTPIAEQMRVAGDVGGHTIGTFVA
jgi:hypothetical protein